MGKEREELEKIFEIANDSFLRNNRMLFETKVSERTLCGALMLELHEVLRKTRYFEYFVDVEYNRNAGGKIETFKRTINEVEEQIVTINCDLLVHSRGQKKNCDNLIALEMKKSTASKCDKESDRNRIECLTKNPEQDVWSYGGVVFPEHVCGYKLGIYYEVNFKRKFILLEYYAEGRCYKQYRKNLE